MLIMLFRFLAVSILVKSLVASSVEFAQKRRASSSACKTLSMERDFD